MRIGIMKTFLVTLAALMAVAGGRAALAQDESPELRTQPRKVEARYEARLRGLTIFAAKLTLDVSLSTYRVRIDGQTAGLGAMVVPATAEWRTAGRIVDDRFMPLTYVARRQWPGRRRSVELTFERDGRIVTQHLPPIDRNGGPRVPEDLQRNSFDPLTALLNATTTQGAEPCNVETQIYNGERRLDVALQQQGYSFSPVAFGGGAYRQIHHCVVTLSERTADDDAAETAGPLEIRPMAVWVTRLRGANVWIPVAASFNTRFGRLEVEMIDAQAEERQLN